MCQIYQVIMEQLLNILKDHTEIQMLIQHHMKNQEFETTKDDFSTQQGGYYVMNSRLKQWFVGLTPCL